VGGKRGGGKRGGGDKFSKAKKEGTVSTTLCLFVELLSRSARRNFGSSSLRLSKEEGGEEKGGKKKGAGVGRGKKSGFADPAVFIVFLRMRALHRVGGGKKGEKGKKKRTFIVCYEEIGHPDEKRTAFFSRSAHCLVQSGSRSCMKKGRRKRGDRARKREAAHIPREPKVLNTIVAAIELERREGGEGRRKATFTEN